MQDSTVRDSSGQGSVTTGDPDVDAALEDLDRLDDLPVDDHVRVFERAQERLRDRLEVRRPPEAGVPTG